MLLFFFNAIIKVQDSGKGIVVPSCQEGGRAMLKIVALLVTLLIACSSTAFATQEITVSGMVELLNSIGSDRIIHLAPGSYKLDDALGFASRNAKNIYERRMYIIGVKNLKISGEALSKTELLSPYSESDVLLIKDCSNIELENFSIGHVQRTKGCEGDALRIEMSKAVKLNNMAIYGCGENGLTLKNVEQLEVKDSYIHHCTYNLLKMSEVGNSRFIATKFVHDGSLSVMATSDKIKDLAFDHCQFIIDPTREVFVPQGEILEYAAKYSLVAKHYSENWWEEEELSFTNCEFTNVNPLEVAQLRTKGMLFKDCHLKGQQT